MAQGGAQDGDADGNRASAAAVCKQAQMATAADG